MSQSADVRLDAEELLHLAIIDSREGRHDAAIVKLKEALVIGAGARVQFMLAAEYAEIGLLDRAIEGMQKAVTLEPSLTIARFQLGLLFFRQNQVAEAESAWKPLDDLGQQNSLFLFKSALLKIGSESWQESLDLIEQGLVAEKGNEALARDMTRVRENIHAHLAKSAPVGETQKVSARLVASRYGDSVNEESDSTGR